MDPITLALAGCLIAFVSFVVGVLCGGCWFAQPRTDFTATHRLPPPTRPAPPMPEVKQPRAGVEPTRPWRDCEPPPVQHHPV